MLDAIPDVLLWCRYDEPTGISTIEWCNETATEATGMKRDEIIGLTPRDLLPAKNALHDTDARRRAYAAAKRYGVKEVETPVLFGEGDEKEYMRVRIVWVDPGDTRVLILARRLERA